MIYLSTKKNRGYTLLFAVLLSSLVLSIGLSILTISRKELILSSTSRESQTSFFAADTGVECSLFHLKAANSLPSSFVCNGQTITPTVSTVSNPLENCIDGVCTNYPDTEIYEYDFLVGSGNPPTERNPCAYVTVTRRWDDPDEDLSTGVRLITTIDSRGLNTCDTNAPRRTERGVRARF